VASAKSLLRGGAWPLAVVSAITSLVLPAGADGLFRDCGVAEPDLSRYERMQIQSVVSKKIRVMDPATRRRDSTAPKVDAVDIDTTRPALRDAYGLVCLYRHDGSTVWTVASSVSYKCAIEQTGLADPAAGGGSMGIGVRGCR
jgi:hypothetical protein